MFSHEPSPINSHRQHTNHFLDDSVLFSQHMNSGTNFQLQTPFTVKDCAERDHCTQDDISRFFNSQENQKFQQKQQQPMPISTEEKPKGEKLKGMIQYANYTLQNYGFSKLGNLLSTKEEEVQKTINAVLEMISQRQRDIEYRKEVFDNIAKLESDNKMHLDQIARCKQENGQLSREVGNLKNLMITTEKKFKSDREKLISEREELSKQLSKFSQKSVQYQHEIRKKEVEVSKMKEQVRKTVLEKVVPKAAIAELVSSESTGEFRHKSSNAYENDFTAMVGNSIDHYRAKLLNENEDLKSCLNMLFKDFVAVIAAKKEEYVTIGLVDPLLKDLKIVYKINEMNPQDVMGVRAFLENQFEGIKFMNLRSGLLELPFDKSASEIQKIFRQNLQMFDLLFERIIKLNVGNQFMNNIAQEYCEINHEFAGMKNAIELKKAVQGFKTKINKIEDNGLNKENEPFQANQSRPMNFCQKESVFSPPPKTSSHTDNNFKFDSQASALYKTPKQDSFVQEYSEMFVKKKQAVLESPPENHVKRARAEVNKWKLALHSKTQITTSDSQENENKLE